ncbi:MAG: histone deacetylase [Planctomycetota bacterium]|nr:histone deacetylase [Planctomycetota bacterium]
MRTGFVTDPVFSRHDTGQGHPERPARIPAVLEALQDLPLIQVDPRDATRPELLRVHAPAYLDALEKAVESLGAGLGHLDADTAVCPESWSAARRSAGAALALGEAWLGGSIDAGFACIRPPGHHACPGRAMGFCLLNNIAILARHLQERGKRVAILDWDVHHGNGTQEIFQDDPELLFVSLHQWPLWPGTGAAEERGAGNIVNIPLPAGSGDEVYLRAFEEQALPALCAHGPDVVLVSAGFDAHARDPLAGMQLSDEAFGTFTKRLLAEVQRPVLSVLEGGYDLQALGGGARAHVQALLEADVP